MKKSLTLKEKKTIDLIASGKTPTQAVLVAYDVKDKKGASVIASNLYHKEMFKKELETRQELALEIIRNEGRKLVEILEEIFPKTLRAQKLKEIAETGDTRAILEAIKEMNKVSGEYPDQKIGIYKDMEGERLKVLTESEVIKQADPNIEEGEYKEELPVIQQSGDKEK